MIAIKYIGKRAMHRDGAYGTGIEWVREQTQWVPADKARLMLRHQDVYVAGDMVTPPEPVAEPAKPSTEDSEETLQDARDAIAAMNKDALEMYAKTHFQQDLDKRQSVEKLRARVVGLIDQYGIA